MERIKSFLRKFPRAYRFAQRAFYLIASWMETRIFGTRLQEWRWRFRSFAGDRSFDASLISPHPHRARLIGLFDAYAPCESVLEVGCGSGDNLLLFGLKHPGAALYGVDINQKTIRAAGERLRKAGLNNKGLTAGRADDLKRFSDKSIDVVFSDAALLYIGSDKIKNVLGEMIRVAKKAVILNEWHSESLPESDPSLYCDAHWVHNYRALLRGFPLVDTILMTPIPEKVWGGSGWKEYGSLIETRLA